MPSVVGVPKGRIVLVTTPFGFGFGLTKEQAVRELPVVAERRLMNKHKFWHCDISTYVDDRGNIIWEQGDAPGQPAIKFKGFPYLTPLY